MQKSAKFISTLLSLLFLAGTMPVSAQTSNQTTVFVTRALEEKIIATVPFRAGFFSSEEQVEIHGILLTPDEKEFKKPYPLVIFNHGSQDGGTTVREPYALTTFFLGQGTAIFFPVRKGFNHRSMAPSKVSANSAEPVACGSFSLSEAGLKSAITDVKALVKKLEGREDLDPNKVVLAGHSRGGFLSVALAAEGFAGTVGVLNFSGGWHGEPCNSGTSFNQTKLREYSEKMRVPVVSFYGDSDNYYSAQYVKIFAGILEKSGQATTTQLPGFDHVQPLNRPDAWGAQALRLLKQ